MKEIWDNLGENNLQRLAMVGGLLFLISYYTYLFL
jgi:hypothetical protein